MWKRGLVVLVCCLCELCLNFPLEKCRSDKIDLAIHVATVTPIQKVRLKSIVNMFLPEADDQIINSRIAIFLSSNLTQPLIGFNTYNSRRDLLQKLENLNNSVERHLQVVETLQENSIRYFHEMGAGYDVTARVAIFILEYSGWRWLDDDINIHKCNSSTNQSYMYTYIIGTTHFENISRPFYTFRDKALITATDNLSDNQFVAMSLCGQCTTKWFLFQSKTYTSKLSCYTLQATDPRAGPYISLARCRDLAGAHVPLIETLEEFDFVLSTLPTLLAKLLNLSSSGRIMSKTILCKRYIEHMSFSQWQNKSKNMLGLSAIENSQEDSCFALEFHQNETNMKESWIQVSTDTDHANLVMCEFDVDVLKLRETDIGIVNDKMMTSIENENLYAAYNVKLFSCGPGRSIPFTFLHDGYVDCPDSSDETTGGRDPDMCVDKFICAYVVEGNWRRRLCDDRNACFLDLRRITQWKCIARSKICDGARDCGKGEDEQNCNMCMETTLPDGTCLPSQWFYTVEKYIFYRPRRDEAIDRDKIIQVGEMLASCNGTECKHVEDVNIHVVRCDGVEYSNSSRLDLQQNVTWAAKCVYLKMRYRKQQRLGCSDMSHLANCEKFVCSDDLFKCPNSYCIPNYMVFDGRSDCPNGEEESIYIRNQIFSPQLFPCREPPVLIHPVHVCDGIDHCLTRDDELHCYEQCPSGFTCGFGVTEVTDHSKVHHGHLFLSVDKSTRVLILSGIDLLKTHVNDPHELINLFEIHLSNCNINYQFYTDFMTQSQLILKHLTFIDLSHNDIDISTFRDVVKRIQVLNFSHTSTYSFTLKADNSRKYVADFSFSKLNSLTIESKRPIHLEYLNLSNTILKNVSFSKSNINVKNLDLRNTSLKFDGKTSRQLKSLTIKASVYGDSYKLCCRKFSCPGIQSVKCFAPDDPISSCNDLLGDSVKRTWLWLTGLIGIVGNVAVVILKFVKHNDINNYTCSAIHIVLSDLIMSVYLLIIAGADVYYRDDYVLYDTEWRDSSLCKAAGFLATLSYTSSGVFVVLVTAQLFLLHRHPTAERQPVGFSLVSPFACVWYMSTMFSLYYVCGTDLQAYTSSAMCIGFPLNTKQHVGWLFSFFIYTIMASVEISLTIIGLVLICKVILFDGSFVESEINNTKTLSLIILSHIFCGSIISITGLLSAVGINISPNRMGWLSVFVLPLNSVVNPLLWICQIVREKWANYKSRT